jgi:sporulation protein YlmC with PRC-barrel domain
MRIELDAKVRTKDGHTAGHVRKVIWDPESNEAREFVVSTGGLLGHDVILSPEVLEHASQDGEEIVLDLTRDELNSLEHYDENEYAPPPLGWLAPSVYSYPTAGFLFPVTAVVPAGQADIVEDVRPRRPSISAGMKVVDASGKTIGSVKELRIDDMTGELRSIVVKEDDPLGGGEAFELPADHLDVGNGEVHVIQEAPGTHPRV